MTATPAQALIVADGHFCWESGLLDPESGMFAYQAWKRNVAYARVIGPTDYIRTKP